MVRQRSGSSGPMHLSGLEHQVMHDDTRKLLEDMLYMLAEKGEKDTFAYIRNQVLATKDY